MRANVNTIGHNQWQQYYTTTLHLAKYITHQRHMNPMITISKIHVIVKWLHGLVVSKLGFGQEVLGSNPREDTYFYNTEYT